MVSLEFTDKFSAVIIELIRKEDGTTEGFTARMIKRNKDLIPIKAEFESIPVAKGFVFESIGQIFAKIYETYFYAYLERDYRKYNKDGIIKRENGRYTVDCSGLKGYIPIYHHFADAQAILIENIYSFDNIFIFSVRDYLT